MANETQTRYEVIEVNTSDVFDFKSIADECFVNRNLADDGKSLSWLKVKWFQYQANDPSKIFFKYQLDDPEFYSIIINRATRLGRIMDIKNAQLAKAYGEEQCISSAKHKDLLKLYRDGHITPSHVSFYKNLKHHSFRDRLSKPDVEEDIDKQCFEEI